MRKMRRMRMRILKVLYIFQIIFLYKIILDFLLLFFLILLTHHLPANLAHNMVAVAIS